MKLTSFCRKGRESTRQGEACLGITGTVALVAMEGPLEAGYWQELRSLFGKPFGVSTGTILTFLLPNEPREPGGDSDAGIFWGKPILTQVQVGFLSPVLGWIAQ